MKLLFVVLALSLGACATFDQYLPRDVQCMLFETARAKAAEMGLTVDQYLDVYDLVQCPAPTVEEAVEKGFTVVE